MTIIDVEGALFDNDGVLSDSIAAAGTAWNRWSARWAPEFDYLSADLHGVRARDVIAGLVPAEQIDQAFAEIEAGEIESAHETQPIRGAAELTSTLASMRWAVVSSASAPLVTARLQAAGIATPDAIVSADDVQHGKPHPDPYLAGARAIGLPPARCVVFEDAPAGIQAARAAGVGFVVGVGTAAAIAVPDALIPDLTAVHIVNGRLTIS